MKKPSTFGAWFVAQYPHHQIALRKDLYGARENLSGLQLATAKARQKVKEIEDAMEAHTIALRAWNARWMQ